MICDGKSPASIASPPWVRSRMLSCCPANRHRPNPPGDKSVVVGDTFCVLRKMCGLKLVGMASGNRSGYAFATG